jgi:hypothetical protein
MFAPRAKVEKSFEKNQTCYPFCFLYQEMTKRFEVVYEKEEKLDIWLEVEDNKTLCFTSNIRNDIPWKFFGKKCQWSSQIPRVDLALIHENDNFLLTDIGKASNYVLLTNEELVRLLVTIKENVAPDIQAQSVFQQAIEWVK